MVSIPKLNPDQLRLLYLISTYSTPSKKGSEGMFIKELALLALIHRGISKGAFDDYDCAPNLVTFHGSKRYANVSQEGNNDLKFMRERSLVSKIKISTKYYDHISAYSITNEGMKALKGLGKKDKARVAAISRCKCGGTQAIRITDENVVEICKRCKKEEEIPFFDLEDVAYKSRPYFPKEVL
jgi:hypothetical protein